MKTGMLIAIIVVAVIVLIGAWYRVAQRDKKCKTDSDCKAGEVQTEMRTYPAKAPGPAPGVTTGVRGPMDPLTGCRDEIRTRDGVQTKVRVCPARAPKPRPPAPTPKPAPGVVTGVRGPMDPKTGCREVIFTRNGIHGRVQFC